MAEKKTTFKFVADDKLTKALKKIQKQSKKTFNIAKNATDKYDKAAKKAGRDTDKLNVKMKKVNATGMNMKSTFIKLGGAMALAFGGREILRLGSDMEKTQAAFNVLLGSKGAGKKMVDNINEMANATPFMNTQLMKSAELMLGFGIAQKNILPNLMMLGDISMGNAQKLASLSLAFAQMTAAGRLMGQDLNQMITAGFNPLKVISEETGQSFAQLKKLMEKGAISSDMVTQAMMKATGAGGQFSGMMQEMMNTVGGKWSTVMGKLQLQMIEIFDKGAARMKKWLDRLDKNLGKVVKTIIALVKLLGMFVTSMYLAKAVMIAWSTATKVLAFAQLWLTSGLVAATTATVALTTAMKANMFGLAITAITGLVMIMRRLQENTQRATTAKRKFDELYKSDPILKNFGGESGIGKMTKSGDSGMVSWYKISDKINAWVNNASLQQMKELAGAIPERIEFQRLKLSQVKKRLPNAATAMQRKSFERQINEHTSKISQMINVLSKIRESLPGDKDDFKAGGVLGDEGVTLSSSRIAKNLTINIGEVVGENGIIINTATFDQSTDELKSRLEEVFREITLDLALL